ncbi:MAG: hypothetical protein AAF891_00240 [Pseudomonadota bacterium]
MNKTMTLRLAFREEGTMWNAYCAQTGTMKGAFLMGSIGIGAVRTHPELKEAFMSLMNAAFQSAVVQMTGAKIESTEVRPAPAHERGKA